MLLKSSLSQIKEAAAKGGLTWKGKKVVFDPFLKLSFFYEIARQEESFSLTPRIRVGSREEGTESYELMTPLGALQAGTFRLWEDPDQYEMLPEKVSAKELEKLLKDGIPHRFQGEKPRLKPAPLPILKLTDRTGGFAQLHLDYGEWGEVPFHNHPPTAEERHWENDLLETGFKKKFTFYYCPLDQVGKSIAFLLEMGWKIFDVNHKRVVKQGAVTCSSEDQNDAIFLRGTIHFGEKEIAIQDVVGCFEKHERWIDLSPHEVGLIQLPTAWEEIAQEEKTAEGIRVRKTHVGLLQEVALLPPEYNWAERKDVHPKAPFRGQLFPYQQQGLSWLLFLYEAGFSGLLADEMGLGKTVQVLAFLTLRQGKVLIVMPVTLLSLWKQQIEQFLPGTDVYIYQGASRSLGEHAIILTSYATLRSDGLQFAQLSFDTIILDEAQAIKNATTQIAQTIFMLKSRFRLALTGTPIENRKEEIDSIFRFLFPIAPKKLQPFILRRTKEEVGLELPEKIVQVIGIDPAEEEYQLYEELLRNKRTALMQKIAAEGLPAHRMEVLELILRLRQQCCHPRLLNPTYPGECAKFKTVLNDLEEVVASQHKAIVYSQFTSMLTLFKEEFIERGWNFVYLDGSTRDRETPIDQFQNNPDISIFLISLKAGGVGLNLQAADYVFLYDPWWNSAVEEQAIARAHRLGRKNTVIARKYYTTQTIEAKILDLQSKKRAIADALWDETSGENQISFEMMAELLVSI